jgi:2,5-diamino-6-(ribosylamino)-4(3H)-pyrimidinone 5'-phosphate reductase
MTDLTRLLPDPGPTTLEEQLATLEPGPAPGGRPYVALNFATTLDGYGAIGGRSGPIGDDVDTAMLAGLRRRFEAVMIGAGTMRAERYGPMPDGRPLVIVSGRLDLPWDAGVFSSGEGRVIVFTAEPEAEPPKTATPVEVIRRDEHVAIAEALGHLRTEHGIESLLCEGGPGLHAQLQRDGLADELFLTIAPKLAGGPGPHILEGELTQVVDLELAWLLEHEGELFARYRRKQSG